MTVEVYERKLTKTEKLLMKVQGFFLGLLKKRK